MDINQLSMLSKEELDKKYAEIKWKQYVQNARSCLNSFNVPRGKMKELKDLQQVTKGNKDV